MWSFLTVNTWCTGNYHSFIYFWHAPLGVCSTKLRHQSPKWTTVSHVSCCIQGEVDGLQVLLGSLHPRSMRASSSSPRRKLISFASIVSLTLTVAVWHLLLQIRPTRIANKNSPIFQVSSNRRCSASKQQTVNLYHQQANTVRSNPSSKNSFFLIEYAINPSNSSQFHHAHITITTEEQPVLTNDLANDFQQTQKVICLRT